MTRKEFHKRLLITSLLLGLVLPLANVPVTSSLNQTKKAAAAEPAVMTFAEGEGTGEEFKEESWVMDSNAAGEPHKGSLAIESYQPSSDTYGIKKNPYSKKETPEKVIRLFDVAKPYSAPESAAEEDPNKSTSRTPASSPNRQEGKNSPEKSAATALPFSWKITYPIRKI